MFSGRGHRHVFPAAGVAGVLCADRPSTGWWRREPDCAATRDRDADADGRDAVAPPTWWGWHASCRAGCCGGRSPLWRGRCAGGRNPCRHRRQWSRAGMCWPGSTMYRPWKARCCRPRQNLAVTSGRRLMQTAHAAHRGEPCRGRRPVSIRPAPVRRKLPASLERTAALAERGRLHHGNT